jgi:hypothetical protein
MIDVGGSMQTMFMVPFCPDNHLLMLLHQTIRHMQPAVVNTRLFVLKMHGRLWREKW